MVRVGQEDRSGLVGQGASIDAFPTAPEPRPTGILTLPLELSERICASASMKGSEKLDRESAQSIARRRDRRRLVTASHHRCVKTGPAKDEVVIVHGQTLRELGRLSTADVRTRKPASLT